MKESIFLIWNGWGLLFTVILVIAFRFSLFIAFKYGPGSLLKDLLDWSVIVIIVLTFVLCNWILGLIIVPVSAIISLILFKFLDSFGILKIRKQY